MNVELRSPGTRFTATGRGVFVRGLLRDRVTLSALVFVALVITAAVGAGVFSPHDPYVQSLLLRNEGPMTPADQGIAHILGTDALGRDQLSRLIYGSRISLTVGLASVLVSGILGTLLGLFAGYYRGRVDDLIMRVVDVQMGFPSLLLALVILYGVGSGFINVVLVLAVTRWTVYARVTRSLTLSLRESAFVDAARAIGCTNRRIIFMHVLPNLLSPLLVLATMEIATVILTEASLDFLGLGIQPPESSWGLMLAQGRQYITTAWWLVTFPGLAILLTTLSFNLLATWLRAVTDPVQRWHWLGVRQSSM